MAAEQHSTPNSSAEKSPAERVRSAIFQMEPPIRDAEARLRLLVSAFEPRNANLDPEGLLIVLADALNDVTAVRELWQAAHKANADAACAELTA